MSLKIVDNKKMDMTDDEWNLYVDICRSYDRPSFKGEELFKGLCETDDNGIIIFLRPPSDRHTSMEAVIFMLNLMTQQHIRLMYNEASNIYKQMKEKLAELDKKISEK